jgi:hypothetical protein
MAGTGVLALPHAMVGTGRTTTNTSRMPWLNGALGQRLIQQTACGILFKEIVSRDFRPLVFFIKQSHLGPLFILSNIFEYRCKFADIWTNMCGPALCRIARDHCPALCHIAYDYLCTEFVCRSQAMRDKIA